jgi:hypothetical protein
MFISLKIPIRPARHRGALFSSGSVQWQWGAGKSKLYTLA